ncbi:OmpA family protein [Jannaschia seohaensis]|uniref:Outer membrane protein OmpA n=1 Tax=Jannaschia seohaensis TaxID=475081 RepID=A0A2Y9B4I6_9RHOB|nr:OmpA family protein [Jannaschia seohaensis]PWJ15058.1 outer membrane protein OmpA-like peptidoglycan-associated protein [Jannaschia seohaensis]SSA49907.1 Outer membrane protein OmpA [Jannaschia seohaensis]
MTLLAKTPVIAAAASLMLAGCVTTPTGEPNRTASGAIIGGLAGAAIGNATGDRDTRSTLIGAAVGAGVGAAIGNALDRQAADLRRQLGDDRIVITNTGQQLIVTMPQDILFATDSANLRADLQGDLRALGRNLQQYPDTTVQVIGHTDSDGSAAYNQDLSERRARAVAGVLLETGVPAFRIRAIGRGESQPIATNNTPEGKQRNRRVEIVITPNA